MRKLLTIAAGLSVAITAVMLHQPTHAQSFPSASRNCVYLREITTRKRVIRKVIELNNSNSNTDFAVPTGVRFSSYVEQLIPENNSRYQANVNLKYNDNTSAQAVSRSIEAKRFYLYNQPFRTPTSRQPFQINTKIKGTRNTAYRVSVLACQ